MQALLIILLSIAAAVTYGIVHDQITARVCVEYFTIGHARLIDTDSPTLLGLFWGVVATWWVGLPLGIGLALVSRLGKRPKLVATDLIRPLCILLLVMFVIAILAGILGWIGAGQGWWRLVDRLASRVPEEEHAAFIADGWAHGASYLSGIIGGVAIWIVTWRRCGRLALIPVQDPS